VRGGNAGSGCAELTREVASSVAALTVRGELTIVELAVPGVIVWRIHRDATGTPHCRFWTPVPWLSLYPDGTLDEAALRHAAKLTGTSPLLLVLSSENGPKATEAFGKLQSDPQVRSAFVCSEPLPDLLKGVLRNDQLTTFYELVVLRLSGSGRTKLSTCALFPPGAKRGDTCEVKLRFESVDEEGTAFAVVAVSPGHHYRLISVDSVKVDPGHYTVTAQLRGPGQVRFKNVPGVFQRDQRGWSALVAAVPTRLRLTPATHLIFLVETSGTEDQIEERKHRVGQLIHALPSAIVSLISYGPHQIGPMMPGTPLEITAWEQPARETQRYIDQLQAYEAGYPFAAQLECALTEIADRLARNDSSEGQPERRQAIVTVASRPAAPPGRDPVTEIIPCPLKRDWRRAVQRLRQHPNVFFYAMLDHRADDDIWHQLGSDGLIHGETNDVTGFAVRVGLARSADEPVPFPIADGGQL
jgi:hypothetical protein